ncbi:MAG: hypothetical protein Q8P84_04800 [Deltaproteobacteria bacterium]|nr:hypothetical protein [Deltaproteobacteria bacterium]
MAIDKTRFNPIRLRKLFGEKTDSSSSGVETYRLPFRRAPNEEYSFENGKILLNGADVSGMINIPDPDIAFLVGLSAGVEEYRNTVWVRYGTDKRDFNGQAQGLLEKLLSKLSHVYEETTGGVKVQLQGGKLWINDIDPKVVLALFLSNPTEERRRYLESIQAKVGLILQGKAVKSHIDGLVAEAKRIFHQIETALQNQASPSHPPLLATIHNLDR